MFEILSNDEIAPLVHKLVVRAPRIAAALSVVPPGSSWWRVAAPPRAGTGGLSGAVEVLAQ